MKVCSSLNDKELGSIGTFDSDKSIFTLNGSRIATQSYKYSSLGNGLWQRVNVKDANDKQIRKVACVHDDNNGNSSACCFQCGNDNKEELIGYTCYLTGMKFYDKMKKCVKDADLSKKSSFCKKE